MTKLSNHLPSFKQMGLNPLTLAFTDKKEDAFLIDFYKKTIIQVRISFISAILLYGLFGLMDPFFAKEMGNIFWIIRFVAILPISMLVLVTTFDKFFHRYRDITMSFSMILFGLGIITMIVLSPKPVDFSYYAALLITFIFVYTLINIRFIAATLTGIIILICYLSSAIFLAHTPNEIILKNTYFFISINLIGMIVAYSIEFYAKRDYYISQILRQNELELSELNQNLEKKVMEKTEILQRVNEDLKKEINDHEKTGLKLIETHQKLQDLYDKTLSGLVSAIETRDPYTVGHQGRVSQLAIEIAKKMKLSDKVIENIRIASTVHDIGKISVPTAILNKTGTINSDEMKILHQHPITGTKILKTAGFHESVSKIVLQHHEKLDGSGYPNKLKGDDILIEAQIITVADITEAMSNERPYRTALGIGKALMELKLNRGKLYNEKIVDICLNLFETENFEFAALS